VPRVRRSVWPRRVVAADYSTAYDYRARYFRDPVMMTGRDAASTGFKMVNVVAKLVLEPDTNLLDVGPGDGTLFRMIGDRVARCHGVDPSEQAVRKLQALFADLPHVSFEVGTCTDLPEPEQLYDVVVINSVIHMLADRNEVHETLQSLLRVCRIGGTVFVGEVPFRQEREHGLLGGLRTALHHYGLRGAARAAYEMYLRPVLRGDPLLVEPMGRTLRSAPMSSSSSFGKWDSRWNAFAMPSRAGHQAHATTTGSHASAERPPRSRGLASPVHAKAMRRVGVASRGPGTLWQWTLARSVP